MEYPELRILNEKLCRLYMYGMSGVVEKIQYPKLRKFNGKMCTLFVLNVWISRKIVHYICTECLDRHRN